MDGKGVSPLTSNPSHRREDVVAWPTDSAARSTLESYLDSFANGQQFPPTLHGPELDFRGADLSGLDLGEAYLFNAVLAGVNLSNAVLVKTTLSGADLRLTNMTGANLTRADADECDATGAIFRGARLLGARLPRARLVESDLRETTLNGARLLGADLTAADLRGATAASLRFGIDDRPTVLSRARLFGCNLFGAGGLVTGPVDIGEHEPTLVDGAELLAWFAAQDAPDVTLVR